MDEELYVHETVEVIARFRAGRTMCEPVKFRRPNGREVVITEIGLRHPTTAGKRTVHMFDVTDGEADYRLAFDSERLTWELVMMGDGR